jgi:hypothetical protein
MRGENARVGPAARESLSHLSLLNLHQERQSAASGYLFLAAADLAAATNFFFCSALLALDCFWVDFFWLDFGDLSPMVFTFLIPMVNSPAAW